MHPLRMDRAGAQRLRAVAVATGAKHLSRCGKAERVRMSGPVADPLLQRLGMQVRGRDVGGRGRNRGCRCEDRPALSSRTWIRPPGAQRRGGSLRLSGDRSARLALPVPGGPGQQLATCAGHPRLNAPAHQAPRMPRNPHAPCARRSKREHPEGRARVGGRGLQATTTGHGEHSPGLPPERAGGFAPQLSRKRSRLACATRTGGLRC